MNDVTGILNAIEQGDAQAVDKLLPLVHEELRRLKLLRAYAHSIDRYELRSSVKSGYFHLWANAHNIIKV